MIRKPFVLLLVSFIAIALIARSPAGGEAQQTVGLFVNDEGAFDGYTLFKPFFFGTAYLIDNEGRAVHSWEVGDGLATPYLLPDGSVIRAGGGGIRQLSWDGLPVWKFDPPSGRGHHDIEVLPNGNVLMIVPEVHSLTAAIEAGRDPALLAEGALRSDVIIEVEPTGPTSGEIVWKWRPWDHLVQDHDPGRDNHGVVADHPELIDINFSDDSRPLGEADWHHTNAVDYNDEFDQIVVSVRHLSEFWVIDHSTTTEQAAGHTGGDSGKGGDLLYRWGNPQAYRAGDASDQQLFLQHDAQWIEPGLPGEGNILVFNNGNSRPGGRYSSVEEIGPPVDGDGNYALTPAQAYGPVAPTWTYAAANPADFYSYFISGVQRLPNGGTLIDSGAQGTFFEVTPGGTTVWEYVNPVTDVGPLTQGSPIPIVGADSGNIVFRAYRYAPEFPAFAGRDLSPGEPIEYPKGSVRPTPTPVTCLAEPPATPAKQLHPCDTDGDGCSDAAENGLDENVGGRREYLYFWDFFDVWTRPPNDPAGWHRDRAITLSDILAIVLRFGRGPALSQEDALAAALTPPSDATSYHAAYDRGPIIGATDWHRAPPDGVINIPDDILGIVGQFGHDCS